MLRRPIPCFLAEDTILAVPNPARFIVHWTRTQALFHVEQNAKGRLIKRRPSAFFQGNVFFGEAVSCFFI